MPWIEITILIYFIKVVYFILSAGMPTKTLIIKNKHAV